MMLLLISDRPCSPNQDNNMGATKWKRNKLTHTHILTVLDENSLTAFGKKYIFQMDKTLLITTAIKLRIPMWR